MKKLPLILPLLILLSPVLGITCQQSCEGSGYDYYICSATNYNGAFSCHATPPYSYCYNSYTEKFGTDCASRCFCYSINTCGKDNTECGTACSSSGCAGTTIDIVGVINRPADTFLNDWSSWDVDYVNTGSVSIWAYVECHVRNPSGTNLYISSGCSYIYSGYDETVTNEQVYVSQTGTWTLLSCSVYEAQGFSPCSSPLVYRDEYDLSPPHTWDVTSSACPPTTFGQCTSGYEGYFQCFANHLGYCEYYSGIGLYCWTDYRDCQTFYSPPRCCSAGACITCSGTTTTVPATTTTTTPSITTTTSEVGISDLDEPFNTSDMPDELRFMNNLTTGLFSMSGSIIAGLFLLVLALSIATIIIVIGKRSLT